MFCTCMVDVANEFNVPTNVFFTSGAAFLGYELFMQTLNDEEKQDVVELSNADTDVSVPSFVKPVPTKVFWDVIRTKDGLEFAMLGARKLREVNAIMVNTFFELETHAVESLSGDISVPTVYPVGPILNLEGSSGKPSDEDVIRWLDSQPPASVVLLCFGSMGSFDEVQVKEIARALEQSGHRFVWSLRQPPSNGTTKVPSDYEDPGVVLPEGFLSEHMELGKLSGGLHRSCCWLIIRLEVATWPVYSEQQMNAFEMMVELGLSVEIKCDYIKNLFDPKAKTPIVSAEVIENGIRRVMEDKEVRRKAKEISEKSRAAVAEGGSSYAAVGNLIQDFISHPNGLTGNVWKNKSMDQTLEETVN
ncbi:putative flavonol 3-O-glucosyltransferase [Helianthus debilis subsp. tardiflorus]